jgi:hypothetical protein
LFDGGLQILDDFWARTSGVWKVVGFFEALVSKPEHVEGRLNRVRFVLG